MRDPERIQRIVELLSSVWSKVPDWRLTQLVINASDTQHNCGPVFYLEDDEFERRLEKLSAGIGSREPAGGRVPLRVKGGTTANIFGIKGVAKSITRASMILAANRALWGEVSSSVRKVFTKADDHDVYIHFVLDGPITDEDQESISCVATELAADFPEHGVKESSVRLDAPTCVPHLEGWYLVFSRREQGSSG